MGRELRAAAGVCALLVAVGVLGLVAAPASGYTVRDPILIDGNADFTAANGVTGGSGTPADPYVIEGWEISSDYVTNIHIMNTDAHFVVRDVFLHGSWLNKNTGLALTNVSHGVVENSEITGNGNGMNIASSLSIAIESNNVSSNVPGPSNPYDVGVGIGVFSSSGVTLSSNVVRSNVLGIGIEESADVLVTANEIASNEELGMSVTTSSSVTASDNVIEENGGGIAWHESLDGVISANSFTFNGVLIDGSELDHFLTNTITTDNLVHGLPILYYVDCTGLDLDGEPAGQVIVAFCTDVSLANLDILGPDVAIDLIRVDGATVTNVTLRPTDVPRVNMPKWGVRARDSTDVSVKDSHVRDSMDGVTFNNVTLGSVKTSYLWDGSYGVNAWYSDGIEIVGNTIGTDLTPPVGSGIHTFRSTNVSIASNFVKHSEVYLQDSEDIFVSNNKLQGTGDRAEGVRFWVSKRVTVTCNEIFEQSIGIRIFQFSSNVLVHHNIVRDSDYAQAQDHAVNKWDDDYPSGGNFWSDYVGVDDYSGPNQDQPGSDGIGDTPYVIDSDSQDRYPLMDPPSCGGSPLESNRGPVRRAGNQHELDVGHGDIGIAPLSVSLGQVPDPHPFAPLEPIASTCVAAPESVVPAPP